MSQPFTDLLDSEQRLKQEAQEKLKAEARLKMQLLRQQQTQQVAPQPMDLGPAPTPELDLQGGGGMEQIMRARTPTAGTALAKTLAAAYVGQQDRKREAAERELTEEDREREYEFKQGGRALEERRVAALESQYDYNRLAPARAVAKKVEQREYDEERDVIAAEQKEVIREKVRDEKLSEKSADRMRDTQEVTDKGTKALMNRLAELQEALPASDRLAGRGPDPASIKDAIKQAFTGGTGTIAGKFPFTFSKDTAMIERLESSEALRTIGSLDVALTPFSDADLQIVTNVGVSKEKDDDLNNEIIRQHIDVITRELKARNAASMKALDSDEQKDFMDLQARE